MKILIADDDRLVLEALSRILEKGGHEVVAQGQDADSVIRLYREHRPELLLLDIRMGRSDGIEAFARILDEDPSACAVFLTTFSDEIFLERALALGAKGYILKQDIAGILPAISAVETGQMVFGTALSRHLAGVVHAVKKEESADLSHCNPAGLTEREREVLRLVASGYNNKEISTQLFLSEGTVRNYISMLLEKLELRDRTQLAIHYLTKEGKKEHENR